MKYVYEDDREDGLTVTEESGGLDFMAHNHPDSATAQLPRSSVRNLRDALNRWLDDQQRNDPDPAGRPVATSEPIYEALVRRLVAEEVARVLPLHRSPQAAVATNTGEPLCIDPGCTSTVTHLEHDPEPKAVGHPEAPAVDWSDKLFGKAEYPEGLKFDYCTGCGHSWGSHSADATVGPGCTAQLGKSVCGCDRVRGCECGHATFDHTAGLCYGSTGADGHAKDPDSCGCTRSRGTYTSYVPGSGYTDCTCLDQT